MTDNDLIRRGDALKIALGYATAESAEKAHHAIAALPAVTVGVPDLTDPVVVHANLLRGTVAMPTVEQIIHLYGVDALTSAMPAVSVGVPTEAQIASACLSYDHSFGLMDGPQRVALMHQAREWLHAWREGFAAPDPALRPTMTDMMVDPDTLDAVMEANPLPPDPAAIREAWEKAYWRMRSYAVHDDACKLNKPPHFDGPCSCGLTAALEEALALIQK